MLALSPLSHFLWPIIIASVVATILGTLFGYYLHGHLTAGQGEGALLPSRSGTKVRGNGGTNSAKAAPVVEEPISLFYDDPKLGQLYRQRPAGDEIDDLTKAGIDPNAAKLLNEAGIWNFQQLALLTNEGKATLGSRFGIHVVNWSWIRARFKHLFPVEPAPVVAPAPTPVAESAATDEIIIDEATASESPVESS
jgi:hypothetical protein